MKDTWHAFIDPSCTLPPIQDGPLSGTRFAAKDVFAVKGYPTSGGNPDWFRTHPPETTTAPAILALLKAGAALDGKTHTDELMYGLNGENVHYGTPVNPKAPDRIPGGSSSGSAVAVSAGMVDFAIGTDTGGSVRIPASYTGIFGMRPTVGRTTLTGVIPLSQTFDTVGWFSRDPGLLALVGSVLLSGHSRPAQFRRVIIASDAWALMEPPYRPMLQSWVDRIVQRFEQVEEEPIAPEGLDQWAQGFRVIQGYDIWQNFGEWITHTKPRFGPGFRERFAWTATITVEERDMWNAKRQIWQSNLAERLGTDTIILLPTAPGPAPQRNTPLPILNAFRDRVLQLTAIAGLGGLPQISLPGVVSPEGYPLGLSVIGGSGTDEALMEWVQQQMAEWGIDHAHAD
ncbi:glutamyl-tRNA(Gln) amidotransferase subunit A [Sulfobacillus acidophilus TPY]|uniref:Amidase n=1 Tax=Sulfobacillus acidophilus (strain ATCC 700253 / DSM 10332 / NAL) TaxID=679936 RepID=G8TUQ2_SULAD|nr:glutamyl-tRNA(Gln) amidotransferase subunit A [Sulfobacillus acidophilus TPY]AEW05776.1 Amidase [Sulfobacillus acidophilus DSM 10332]